MRRGAAAADGAVRGDWRARQGRLRDWRPRPRLREREKLAYVAHGQVLGVGGRQLATPLESRSQSCEHGIWEIKQSESPI